MNDYCIYCDDEIKHKSKICRSCQNVLRSPLKFKELNKDNIRDYTLGDINRWMIENVPRDKWEVKIIEILNMYNPNIEYYLDYYDMKKECEISYRCKIHPYVNGKTKLRPIFYKQSGNCRTCTCGDRPNRYWTIETVKSELKNVITEYYNETKIIPYISLINSELIPGINQVLHKLVDNPAQFYLDFLNENNFPMPDDGLFKDGVLFRGHYEYVGYCFIKAWGINVTPTKKMDRYYSDGYFVDIDTYWEHWGELNKNNTKKKNLYIKNKLNLFETYDRECIKHGRGYEYLYNIMRDFFISKGYTIPEYNRNELYALLKKEVVTFESTLNWVVGILKDNSELNENVTVKKLSKNQYGNKIVFFIQKHFNGISNFKEYLNEHYGFNYPIERHADKEYYLSKENLFKELTPIVKKYGRLPSRIELESEGRRDIDRFIKRQIGGFKDMRRNEIQIGKYFHIIDNMLDGKAPWDLKIDWDTNPNETLDKIVQYYKDSKINLPYYFADLKNDEIYGSLGKQLYNVICKRTSRKIDTKDWTDFKRKYDGYDGPEIPEKPYIKINIKINSIIGNWYIIKELDYRYYNSIKNNRIRNFLCKCICGTEREVRLSALLKKNSNCGCMTKEKIDYNKKYGKLKILKEVDIIKRKNRHVIVKCDCGKIKRLQYTYIRNNKLTNCGCVEPIYKQIKRHTNQECP